MKNTELKSFWICYKEASSLSDTWIDHYIYSDEEQAMKRLNELVKINLSEKEFYFIRLVTLQDNE